MHSQDLTSVTLDLHRAQRGRVQQLLAARLGHRPARRVGLPGAMAVHVQEAVTGLDDLWREHPPQLHRPEPRRHGEVSLALLRCLHHGLGAVLVVLHREQTDLSLKHAQHSHLHQHIINVLLVPTRLQSQGSSADH